MDKYEEYRSDPQAYALPDGLYLCADCNQLIARKNAKIVDGKAYCKKCAPWYTANRFAVACPIGRHFPDAGNVFPMQPAQKEIIGHRIIQTFEHAADAWGSLEAAFESKQP